MRGNLNFERIFPVRDPASAQLMLAKAEHLFEAGIIDHIERRAVIALYLDVMMRQPATSTSSAIHPSKRAGAATK